MSEDKVVEENNLHEINIKGYINQGFIDSQTSRKFQDVTYGYGKILFIGTKKELDEYLDWLVQNEGKLGFKII